MSTFADLKSHKHWEDQNWCSRILRSLAIVFGFKGMNVDDFASTLDQILLVDTLLLGFGINLMTASALGKDDFTDRDAWSLSVLNINPDESYPGIMSYSVVHAGSLCVSFLFTSLGIALIVYMMLNFSEARESERMFEIWRNCFLVPVWISFICLLLGLYYFYRCYNQVVEMIFPLYCVFSEFPSYQEIASPTSDVTQIYDTDDATMQEIQSGAFNACKSESYTYQLFENSFFVTWLVLVLNLGVAVFLNFVVHLFSINEEKPYDLDPAICTLLENCFDQRHCQDYHDTFEKNFITVEQMPRLTYEQLRELGLPVGHAMALLDAIKAAAHDSSGQSTRKAASAGSNGEKPATKPSKVPVDAKVNAASTASSSTASNPSRPTTKFMQGCEGTYTSQPVVMGGGPSTSSRRVRTSATEYA